MVTILRGGRPAAGAGGRQAARRKRPDDLQLAQTLRDAGTGQREAPPPARAGERSAEEDGGRSGSRDRRAPGNHAKKMVAHVCAGSRSRLCADAGCRVAARAPCYPSRGRRSATRRGSSGAMRRPWRSCASSRASIRGTATGRSGSFSRAGGTRCVPNGPSGCGARRPARAASAPASAGGHASPPAAAPDREKSRVGL